MLYSNEADLCSERSNMIDSMLTSVPTHCRIDKDHTC